MLVVLVIIAGMIGLLFPAIHASRESAHKTGCLNNLHQLRIALQQYVDTNKDAPPKNGWPVSILPWIEESATLTALKDEKPDIPRPAVFDCPSRPGFDVEKLGIQPNCYAIVIYRPEGRRKSRRYFLVADRGTDLTTDELAPWWVGPELSTAEFGDAMKDLTGPHRGGTYQQVAVQVGR
jgi:hypothetical protein